MLLVLPLTGKNYMMPGEAKEEENYKVKLSITGIAEYVEVRSIYIIKASAKFLFWFGLKKIFLH